MTKKVIINFCIFLIIFISSDASFATHPFITDDTGTQGKGKFQLEFTSQKDYDQANGTRTEKILIGATITYGISETVDIALSSSYQFLKTENEQTIKVDRLTDITIDSKWKLYEKNNFSLALKPGITFPTANEQTGSGTGKVAARLFFISSLEQKPWALHFNLGYIRNENKIEERVDLWHISLAASMELIRELKFGVNIGLEQNRDKEKNEPPAFLLGGIIYSLNEIFDLDFGLRIGLNKSEPDLSLLVGLTYRF